MNLKVVHLRAGREVDLTGHVATDALAGERYISSATGEIIDTSSGIGRAPAPGLVQRSICLFGAEGHALASVWLADALRRGDDDLVCRLEYEGARREPAGAFLLARSGEWQSAMDFVEHVTESWPEKMRAYRWARAVKHAVRCEECALNSSALSWLAAVLDRVGATQSCGWCGLDEKRLYELLGEVGVRTMILQHGLDWQLESLASMRALIWSLSIAHEIG